jgi:hypothetical protein
MSDGLGTAIQGAFAAMVAGPMPLIGLVQALAQDESVTSSAIAERLAADGPNTDLSLTVAQHLRLWDHLDTPGWGLGTSRNTSDRRKRTYAVLEISEPLIETLDARVPPAPARGPVVITDRDEVDPWFDPVLASGRYYWKSYADYLATQKHWDSVDDLDLASSKVVANLANPAQLDRYQARGLVVGYVQSGKTANFAGVIAKAADAGYRLFIVLTGTTNILRRQTQRRLDKELLGRPFVGTDYEEDPDWGEFITHDPIPSALGLFDWWRLTGPASDYRSLGYGAPVLEFKRANTNLAPNDPVNLLHQEARILVVKKNAPVLRKVSAELGRYKAELADIPALIIDDESDQASLDTTKPSLLEERKRTAVNKAIIKLRTTLPRAQYVGYTATPFANVFVNPEDNQDLFPRDFIVALDRPPGYMGATDFHDLTPPDPAVGSNDEDFVRALRGDDEAPDNLLRAVDTYVLTGGLKLYRAERLGMRFPHHTMLVHVSRGVDDHTSMKGLLERTVATAGYHGPDAVDRLRRLYESDIVPVARRRGPEGGHPQTFSQLTPFLARCWDLAFSDKNPILIVNGQKDSDTPDFDRDKVWRILVGGNKLSRGYTIEGLTVSYYRRQAEAADTLMQMGRWFGYREGYQDLVRLFIGREESIGAGGEYIDLYKAFEAACRDEIAFREELTRYVGLPGEQRIRPETVPPLVRAHMLRPTAKNKMYRAELVSTNLGGRLRQPTVATSNLVDSMKNIEALRQLLTSTPEPATLSLDGDTSTVLVWTVEPGTMLEFLRSYRWQKDTAPLQRDIEFLSGAHFEPGVSRWVVLAPQLKDPDPNRMLSLGDVRLTVKHRHRDQTHGRYGVYSEPEHVALAEYICGKDRSGTANTKLRELASDATGVMLLYPVQDYDHETDVVTVGFALQYPDNNEPTPILWKVRDPAASDDGAQPTS